MNELAIKDFSVNFKAPEILITNEDELAQAVEDYAKKYNGLIVTEETLADSKKARADLNKLSKALNDRRKEIKRNYGVPLKEFETKVKQWDSNLHDAMDALDVGINDLKQKQREEREQEIKSLIAQMAPAYGIEPYGIEIQESWKNKSLSHKKLVDAIGGELKYMQKQHEDLKLVEEHCKKNNRPFLPYREYALAFGPLETIKRIDDEIEQEHQAKEAENAAHLAEVEKMRENTVEYNGKGFDKDTGEVVKEEQKVTFTLQGSREDIDGLARYVRAMGIKVLNFSEREPVIVKG